MLAKNPGVTAVAVLALALGIGVNTSCFLWLDALVLHPLPFPQIERVMTLWETIPKLQAERDAVAPANFLDWLNQSHSFEHLAAYSGWDATLTGVDEPERVQVFRVTPSFFPLLGMKPGLGRTFSSDEAVPGHDAVVVVSHSFWQQRLGAASDAMGRKISLTGRTYTVVGVMPDDFDFPLATDLWVPLALTPEERNQRAAHTLAVLGRMKPQIPVAQARAEMETIARRLEQQYPQTNEARDIKVVPLRELTNIGTDRFVMTLVGAAAFVLLLACANVANLQLARAAGRQKEMAVRAALGASGFRITRQLLIENILLALAAGGFGLVLADWNHDWSMSSIPPQVFRWVAGMRTLHFEASDFVFTLAASLAAGILCGVPAIVQTLRLRASFGEALKEGGRTSSSGPSRSRLRAALVVAEVALALVLLVGAGLMVKTFHRMLTIKAGFNPNNLLTMQIALPAVNYREDAQVAAFYDRVLRGLESTPQVKAAGAVGFLGIAEGLYIEGKPEPRPGEPRPNIRTVSEHYNEAMGIPILRGRAISAADGAESPRVAVISESVANHYWPASDPIGHRIKLGNAQSPWLTVVGVCGDVKDWFSGQPIPRAVIPYRQAPQRSMILYIRTTGDPLLAVKAARAEVRNADPNQAVFDVKSMEQELADETSGVRASAQTMSMYAVIALLLAATGIYAVISYAVVQRTHEIGVRLALGAGRSSIVRMIVAQAFRLAALGLAIGVPVAYMLTRIMSSALYNTVALDPLTFAAFTGVLGLSALLAGYIPARRATRVDPTVALHHE